MTEEMKLLLAAIGGGGLVSGVLGLLTAVKQGKVTIFTKNIEVNGTLKGKQIEADVTRETKLWEEVERLRQHIDKQENQCHEQMRLLEARVDTLEAANFRYQAENVKLQAEVMALQFAVKERDNQIEMLLSQHRTRGTAPDTGSILIPDDVSIVKMLRESRKEKPHEED